MKTNITPLLQGLEFRVIGPFFVADLSSEKHTALFEQLPLGEHGAEEVVYGQSTESHSHEFPSYYLTEGLNVENDGQQHVLPQRALTLVLPGDAHSWIPQTEKGGTVGSVGHQHAKQKCIAAQIARLTAA